MLLSLAIIFIKEANRQQMEATVESKTHIAPNHLKNKHHYDDEVPSSSSSSSKASSSSSPIEGLFFLNRRAIKN